MTDENKKDESVDSNEATTQPILKPQEETEKSLSLRDSDTARLKKMKPKPTGPSTDTVQLKVIKEKKKQLAGILTASQTIKLRPETGSSSSSNVKLKSSDQVSGSVDSLRAQRTSSADSGTIKVSKPSSPAGGASTLKIKSSSAAGGASTLKIKNTASTGGTLKLKNTASTGGTLKLKNSGGDQGTLKLKSAPAQESQGSSSESAEAAPKKSGKAVALKQSGQDAGIVYTIFNVVSVAAAILAVYKTFEQMNIFYK